MASVSWLVLPSLLLLAGYQCSHFDSTLQDDATKYACTGSTATLPWTMTQDESDQIVDIQWLFNGRSEEMVAMFAHGNFLAMPAFSHRVRHLPTSGIAISHVTAADKGDYSVQITGRNSKGEYFSLKRTVHLVVLDSILSSDGLMVSQEPRAVYSTLTKEWAVELTCGSFVYPGDSSPFHVQWTDPAGNILTSTSYSNGTFHLALPNPVTEGNFTCQVPSQVENCSPEGEGGQRRATASVAVNGLVARVTVLEALHGAEVTQNQQLQSNASRMVEENESLRKSVTGLEKSQTELTQQAASFRQQIDNLQTQANSSALSQLVQRVQTLEASTHHQDNDHASQIHDLQNQLDRLKQTAAQCCLKNTQLTQQTHTLSQQYAELSTELLNVQRQLNSSGSSLLKDIAGLNQRLNQVDQKCSALDTTVASLGGRVNSASQASSALSKQVSGLQLEVATTNQLGSSLTQQVTGLKTQMTTATQATSGMQRDLRSVQSQMTNLASRTTTSDVSFHVTMSQTDNAQPGHGHSLVLSHVVSNQGNGYSATSGRFTAPASATYILMATISAWTKGHYAEAYLMRGDDVLGYVETYTDSHYESGTTHAVVRLAKGQSVWLKNNGDSYYNYETTVFSGALLFLHP